MALPKNSTISFFNLNEDAAVYVDDLLMNLPNDSALTMTIRHERSGAYSVQTAIDTSLDDYEQEQVASFFSQTQVNT